MQQYLSGHMDKIKDDTKLEAMSPRLGSEFLDAQSSNSNMLLGDDQDFVKDQIKNLDKHFED